MLKDYLRKITRISHTESIDNCNSNRLIDPHQVHTTSDFLRVPCLAGTLSNCCMFHAEQSCNHHFSSTKKRLSIMSTMTLKPSKGKVHYLIHSSHFMHCQAVPSFELLRSLVSSELVFQSISGAYPHIN